MTDNAYKPAGYCPHCGYAIDPGVCSECGKDVATDQITRVPYWLSRRRRVKRALLTLLVVVPCACGWYVYARCNWIAWVPTHILLALPWNENAPSTLEVWRRFSSGQLSSAQMEKMFRKALSHAQLYVRSPHPKDEDISVEVWLHSSLVAKDGRLDLKKWGFCVDGKGNAEAPGGENLGRVGCYVLSSLRALSAGTHEIRFDAEFGPRAGGPPMPGVPTVPVSVSRQVVVEDRPVRAYVQPVWSEGIEREIIAKLSFTVAAHTQGASLPSFTLFLKAQNLSRPVAGTLWARVPGEVEYEQLVTIPGLRDGDLFVHFLDFPAEQDTTDPRPRDTAGLRLNMVALFGPGLSTPRTIGTMHLGGDSGFGTRRWGTASLAKRVCDRRVMDVRFLPDARVAFQNGCPSYVDLIIEWEGVPVAEVEPRFVGSWLVENSSDPKGGFPPTRVLKRTTSKPDP